MNLQRLQEAETEFFNRFPGGFSHPDMLAIGKKHQMEKRIEQAREWFAIERFEQTEAVVEKMVKMVNGSSLVSLFEKPKFRDAVKEMDLQDQIELAGGLQAWLHGDVEEGFNGMLEVLKKWKLAKWPILTVIPNYFRPEAEVFLKPTTVKGVIAHFELEGLVYSPKPSWDFYHRYRDAIQELKKKVDPELGKYNAAFCGFLMMSIAS
ncbi:MAG: hypothetical protein MI748_00310 [Opitutales bacterium]|nr:hypothetical protein [Opitutales bacterium]